VNNDWLRWQVLYPEFDAARALRVMVVDDSVVIRG